MRAKWWGSAAVGAVVASALLGPGASPPARAAEVPAAITLDSPCYVTVGRDRVPRMTVSGSGFVPGDPVEIGDSRGSVRATTTASATGTISVTTAGPRSVASLPGVQSDTITATDDSADGTIQATAPTRITRFLASIATTRRAPGLQPLTLRTIWSFSGFPEGRTIYGHYLSGRRVLATQRFGVAQGPCGTLSVTRRAYPTTPHQRSYTVALENTRRYSRSATPRLLFRLGLNRF